MFTKCISKLRDAPPPKKRENVGIFPKWGTPPSPLFGNVMFVKKKLWFILHFRTLGTFLVFTKMFKQKIPTLSSFVKFLYRMSTRGPKTKLT